MNIHVVAKTLNTNILLLEVGGEADIYTTPKIREVIDSALENGYYNIIIDLRSLQFIDSNCIHCLIATRKLAVEHSGNVVLVCTNPNFMKIFTLTGLNKLFPVFGRLEDALGSFVEGKAIEREEMGPFVLV